MTEEHTRQILVAEDDDDDYLIFTIAINDTRLAVAVTRAVNGEELMKLLEASIPDILFLDMEMPCKDGRQCLKEIRANQQYDELPVIIYSSFTDTNTIEFCFRQGSNLYVIKPNSIGELSEVLRRILTIDWTRLMYFPPKSEFVINP